MKIMNLTEDSHMYTSNVYLVLGTWNAIDDVNTLVDVGRDPIAFERMKEIATGVGKRQVDQVILTHCHYDHVALLPSVCKIFNPTVLAFSRSLKGVNRILKNGDTLKIGDRMFRVFHTPGHSHDSICLYCEKNGVLFTGDTPVAVLSAGRAYEDAFVTAFENICRQDIRAIYPGHGHPILDGCNKLIRVTLHNIRQNQRRNNAR